MHRVKEPNPFEVMSPHVVGSQERQTSSRGSFKQKWPPMGSIEKNLQLFLEVAKKGARVCVKTNKKNRKIRREREQQRPEGNVDLLSGPEATTFLHVPSSFSPLLLLLKINQQTTPTSNQTKFYILKRRGDHHSPE
jgi:hypothetical protein